MMPRCRKRPARRGSHIVEAALVLPILLLFLLGLAEYCRLVLILQLTENAAREGARYAVARTGDGTTKTDIENYVKSRMAGQDGALAGMTIDVLSVDPATGQQVAGSSWDEAPFGGAIMVRVSGTYSAMIPGVTYLTSSLPVRATAMMTSEAN